MDGCEDFDPIRRTGDFRMYLLAKSLSIFEQSGLTLLIAQ